MVSSNLQNLVDTVVAEINKNPDMVIQKLLGNDKKILAMYNMANNILGLDKVIKNVISSIAAKTPEQYAQFEQLITGVINGDPAATEIVKNLIMGTLAG